MKKNKITISALLACICLQGYAQEVDKSNSGKPENYADKTVHIGYNTDQRLEESTASTFTIYSEDFNKRGAKNVTNSLFGHGLGLTVLQGSGTYINQEATFYVRGLQSLSSNSPLILVDGIERDLTFVVPEEVESVTMLKDAAAVAIYGYKGINGVVNVISKRGKSNTREVKISYDHSFDSQTRRPEFADAYTYAGAMNEALVNDGLPTRYSADELNAFRSGTYPYLYPNVNWLDGTFKDKGGISNIYNISFRGGGVNFRYYAMANLTNNSGFIANPDANDGYSTQDMYSKANLRTNLDVDLTPKTRLKFNLLGTLGESRAPGANTTDYTGINLWDMIYTLPSAAYPAQLEDEIWGGNAIWPGTGNPIAMSQAAAYSKSHDWSIFADMTLSQDLSGILPGLGATALLAYDNVSNVWENHSKTFIYGSDAVSGWANGVPATIQRYTGGTETGLGTSSAVIGWNRVFNSAVSLNYNQTFDLHSLYSQLQWDYEYRNRKGLNQTWYRQNISLYTHYGYEERYYADLTLVASQSNKLAPGSKWAFSPTIAAAWILSKEDFMKNISWIDFLKLRTSFGIINADRLPLSGGTEQEGYWEQVYSGGTYYPFDTGYSVGTSSWTLGRLASLNSKREKAFKYNAGMDATLFRGLDLTIDGYYQRRSDIWVSSSGRYSSVLGFTAPFENGGIVDSWGTEIGANYTKSIGNTTLNVGANFTFAKSRIVEMMEEPRLYSNLEQTGNPLNTLYGLQAIGFFKDPADIDASPKQMFGSVKPGDIKYKDINLDNQIDENDKCAIGYSDIAPEIYYSFHLGAEWKGLGFDFLFQGAGRYSAVLNTKSLYWPLISNTTISRHYYDNRWTSDNQNAKYPRLTSQSNENNFQTNTIWVEDRSFLKLRTVEFYYRFSQSLVDKTKFMKGVKLYLRGVDLFCFDHIKITDPEAYGATSPMSKSVIAGLTVQF
ncbi:MAG: SusC/RagA family TonB-linked outer membrane protein [Tannerella sp.]|jgi:TonB-linked SusC/RagA family outer membrane protein|nr:SusC/RagA family TonB-linked outer membrane protein [Tannerella sp.]